MKWILIFVLLLSLPMGLISCTSSGGSSDNTEAFDEDGDEFADEDSDDEFGEEDDFSGDEGGDEFADDSEDEFSDDGGDEFADESADDEFGEGESDEFADEGGDGFSDDEFSDDEFAQEDDALGDDEFSEEEGLGGEGDEFAEEGGLEDDALSEDDIGGDAFAEESLDETPPTEDPFAEEEVAAAEAPVDPAAGEDFLGEEPAISEDPNAMAIGGADPFAADEPIEPAIGPGDVPVEEAVSTATMMPGESFANQVVNISFLAEENGGTVVIETSAEADYQLRTNPRTRQHIVEIAGASLPTKLKRPIITKEFPGTEIGSVNAYQTPGSNTARVVVQMQTDTRPGYRQEGKFIYISGIDTNVIAGGGAPTEEIVEETVMDAPMEAMPEDPPLEEVAGGEEIEYVEEPYDEATAQGGPAGPGDGYTAAPAPQAQETVSFGQEDVANGAQVLKSMTLDEFLTTNQQFYGKKISLEVDNAPVRDVLKFIAEQSGLNLVISNDVDGETNLKLKEIPWDQALILLLRSQNLGYHRQGSVLRVAPLSRLRAEATEAQAVEDAKNQSRPLAVKVISVSYSAVEDMAKQVEKFLTKDRGKVTADKRTSSLVVSDFPEQLEVIEKLVRSLDLAPPQVLIEGKIVEASEDFSKDLGVNWSFSGDPIEIGDNDGVPVELTPSLSVSPLGNGIATGGLDFNVNLGTLPIFGNLAARLAIFEQQSKVKVLSSPKITVLTNEKANINTTTELPLIGTTVSTTGETSKTIEFKPVSLQLSVTPQVTADDSVILDVDMTRGVAGAVVDAETQARAVNSRTAKSKVLVQNGQTAVIGGIYQSDVTETETGVPVLRKIPILGRLFEAKSKTNNRNELLIFVTPRVLGKSISATN